jgi:hypothetical protein
MSKPRLLIEGELRFSMFACGSNIEDTTVWTVLVEKQWTTFPKNTYVHFAGQHKEVISYDLCPPKVGDDFIKQTIITKGFDAYRVELS